MELTFAGFIPGPSQAASEGSHGMAVVRRPAPYVSALVRRCSCVSGRLCLRVYLRGCVCARACVCVCVCVVCVAVGLWMSTRLSGVGNHTNVRRGCRGQGIHRTDEEIDRGGRGKEVSRQPPFLLPRGVVTLSVGALVCVNTGCGRLQLRTQPCWATSGHWTTAWPTRTTCWRVMSCPPLLRPPPPMVAVQPSAAPAPTARAGACGTRLWRTCGMVA